MYLECGQGEKCVLQSVDSKAVHQPRPSESGERGGDGARHDLCETASHLRGRFPLLTQMPSCCECISTWLSHSKGLSFTRENFAPSNVFSITEMTSCV